LSCEKEAEEQTSFGFRMHFESRAELVKRLERYLIALEAVARPPASVWPSCEDRLEQ
jgi:hypothetical protein